MSSARRASPSSRSARATACRTSGGDRHRRQGPLRRRAEPPPAIAVIEVSAFVSPKWVPQMADADAVFAGIARRPGVRYTALVPNLAGLDRALAARVDEVAVFAAASERFSVANINQSIDESLARYAEVVGRGPGHDLPVRGYVSCAFGCPFEGAVAPAAVIRVTSALLDMGVYEVAVSDTIGVAHPGPGAALLGAADRRRAPGRGWPCTSTTPAAPRWPTCSPALDAGITTFDASAGGLGGCPYAPGAAGNLATEDLLYMLDGLGIDTGVSRAGVMAASLALQPRSATRCARPTSRRTWPPAGDDGARPPRVPGRCAGRARRGAGPGRGRRTTGAADPRPADAVRVRVRAAALRLRRLGLQPQGRRQRAELAPRVHDHPGLSARRW